MKFPEDWGNGDQISSSEQKIKKNINYEVQSSSIGEKEAEISSYESSETSSQQKSSKTKTLQPAEATPGFDDKPVLKQNDDLLGSSDFANYLAKRIIQIFYGNSGAIEQKQFVMVHLYGAWGSGKTSFLHFLENAFINDERTGKTSSNGGNSKNNWSIVWFNAWREQHREPPWWALMDAIFQANKSNLKIHHRISEYLYRLKSEKVSYLLTILVILVLIGVFSYLVLNFSNSLQDPSQTTNETLLGTVAEQAGSITTILALFTTLCGIVYIGVRSLIFGSAQAVISTKDLALAQRRKVQSHFENLIKNSTKNVAIFIDDLDRCKAEYVVELLEGIQTLLKQIPVVVVVAADRRWLHESYREVYSGFSSTVKEPGRPMEYLFLEKAFQMSVPMPELSDDLQMKYLTYLLGSSNKDKERRELELAREKAKDLLKGKNTEDEILEVIESNRDLLPIEKRALILEAMVLLADKVPLENIERDHRLRKFAPLLEPNPRAMKRFVNDWDINRNIARWMEIEIDKDQLALWTILMRRWPSCARDLQNHPEEIRKFRQLGNMNVPDSSRQDPGRHSECSELFTNDEIRRVINGMIENQPLTVQIDETVIEKCRFLCAS